MSTMIVKSYPISANIFRRAIEEEPKIICKNPQNPVQQTP